MYMYNLEMALLFSVANNYLQFATENGSHHVYSVQVLVVVVGS